LIGANSSALEEKWRIVNEAMLTRIKDCEHQAELLQLAASFTESFMGGFASASNKGAVDLLGLLSTNTIDLNDFKEKSK
jgi:hypothetical protein